MIEKVTYKNMVQALLEAVPEIKGIFENESNEWAIGPDKNEPPPEWWDSKKYGDWYEEKGSYEFYPHLVYEEILCEYIRQILDEADSSEKVRRIFSFFEQMASSEDFDVRTVIKLSILEGLGGNDLEILDRIRKYLGPKTEALCFGVAK